MQLLKVCATVLPAKKLSRVSFDCFVRRVTLPIGQWHVPEVKKLKLAGIPCCNCEFVSICVSMSGLGTSVDITQCHKALQQTIESVPENTSAGRQQRMFRKKDG